MSQVAPGGQFIHSSDGIFSPAFTGRNECIRGWLIVVCVFESTSLPRHSINNQLSMTTLVPIWPNATRHVALFSWTCLLTLFYLCHRTVASCSLSRWSITPAISCASKDLIWLNFNALCFCTCVYMLRYTFLSVSAHIHASWRTNWTRHLE